MTESTTHLNRKLLVGHVCRCSAGIRAGRGVSPLRSRSLGLGTGVALVAALTLLVAAPASAGTVDQQCGSADDTVGSEPLSMTTDWAQTFKAGLSGELDEVTLQEVADGGSPQTKVEVRATGADGKPTGSALATSSVATVSAAFPGQNVAYSFSSPMTVTAGQSYALLPYQVNYDGTANVRRCDKYPQGTVFYDVGGGTGNWTDLSEDFVFATYVAQAGSGGGDQPTPGTSPPGTSPPGTSPPDTSTPSPTANPRVRVTFPKRNHRYSRRTVRRRFKWIRGRVTNAGGVNRVRVSVKRKRGRRCYWLTRRKLRKRSCHRPVYLRARGVSSWKVRLSKRQRRLLRPGRYTLTVRLDDSSGNRMDADGRTSVRFRVRR